MNTELLERIAAHIEANPKGFDMSYYTNECGTTCCIAGEAVRMTTTKKRFEALAKEYWALGRIGEPPLHQPAIDALQITEDQAGALFYAFNWPEQFREQFDDVDSTRKQRASIGAARIRHFIATEGRE